MRSPIADHEGTIGIHSKTSITMIDLTLVCMS